MNIPERWQKLERILSEAVSQARDQLSTADAELVCDFIENREYGVAHDWLKSLIAEGELNAPEAERLLSEADILMRD